MFGRGASRGVPARVPIPVTDPAHRRFITLPRGHEGDLLCYWGAGSTAAPLAGCRCGMSPMTRCCTESSGRRAAYSRHSMEPASAIATAPVVVDPPGCSSRVRTACSDRLRVFCRSSQTGAMMANIPTVMNRVRLRWGCQPWRVRR